MSDIAWPHVDRILAAQPAESTSMPREEVVRLFAELRLPLLRYLQTLGVSIADGEDIAQETFLALFRHLLAGKPRDNLNGWVFRVARNLALKRIQQNLVTPVVCAEAALPDPSANPEHRVLAESRDRTVRAVMAALPDMDRQCLSLRAAGLRYREIAEVLGISLGSVALAVSRSLERVSRAAQR